MSSEARCAGMTSNYLGEKRINVFILVNSISHSGIETSYLKFLFKRPLFMRMYMCMFVLAILVQEAF